MSTFARSASLGGPLPILAVQLTERNNLEDRERRLAAQIICTANAVSALIGLLLLVKPSYAANAKVSMWVCREAGKRGSSGQSPGRHFSRVDRPSLRRGSKPARKGSWRGLQGEAFCLGRVV